MRPPFLLALRRSCDPTPKPTVAANANNRNNNGGGGNGGGGKGGGGGGVMNSGGPVSGGALDIPWNNGEPTMFLNKATKVGSGAGIEPGLKPLASRPRNYLR